MIKLDMYPKKPIERFIEWIKWKRYIWAMRRLLKNYDGSQRKLGKSQIPTLSDALKSLPTLPADNTSNAESRE